MDALVARAHPVTRRSNRFCPPARRHPYHHLFDGTASSQGMEMFSEGGWSAIRIRLEARGWSPMQIELIHDQLRQGWPLTMAARQVALATGVCPLRSRPLG